MHKLILIFILSLYYYGGYGQEKILVHDPYPGRILYPVKTTEIDSLNQLPEKEQSMIRAILHESMSDFENNIVFIKGQIIDVEAWFARDSVARKKYQSKVPKYQLNFELRDTSIGIIKYAIRMNIDQYGQLIKFDWPRGGHNKRADFVNRDSVLNFAVSYAKNKGYKTEVRKFGLRLLTGYQKLGWYISFLQEPAGEEKKYKTIIVDVKSLFVLGEEIMTEGPTIIN